MFLRMEHWLTMTVHLENSSLPWLSFFFVSRPPACQTLFQALLSGDPGRKSWDWNFGVGSLVRGHKDPTIGGRWSGDSWPAASQLLLSVAGWGKD